MEVIVFIGSLRGHKFNYLRKTFKDINFIELSSDLIYTSWNNKYIKTSSLVLNSDIELPQIVSVVDRPWFLSLVQRWCPTAVSDYRPYLAECRKFESALIEFLSQFRVKKSICLYGIAHHVWNNIAESSLSHLGVESIKIYPVLDTNHSILLSGVNEVNQPYMVNHISSDLNPSISRIHDAMVGSLIQSRPKYTRNELTHGDYYIKTDKNLIVSAIMFALGDVKRLIKSVFIKEYSQFAFSSVLPSPRYSLISKSINLVSQSLFMSAYKQISRPVSLESLRGQILLFAHFQPEATTSPEGGDTWNHLELIVQLKCVFPHLQIFYKEHPASALAFDSAKSPTQVGLCRSVAYLDSLQALGVKVLDLNSSITVDDMKSFDIIPVTIGGTIALQCAINGHYAIYSGYPWYKCFSSILPIYQLGALNATTFFEAIKNNIPQNPDSLLTDLLDLMKPFLVPNIFRFGLGPPKNDRHSVSGRIKLLRALIDS